jgi:X-Pro dipeptidyl-peptidase
MSARLTRSALALSLLAAPLVAVLPPSHASTVAAIASATRPAASSPPYELEDGKTKPIYSYERAIRESVWVEAPDGDGDGKKDLITVDIVRPRELAGKAKIPVIMDPSPYYLCCGRGNESERKSYDGDGDPLKMPLYYDNYFVPRGYAYAGIDMAGTARSTGCSDHGARSDIGSIKAVIDWLNGRARAVDADGKRVKARWTNGASALIGKSYDGTLAQGVAATGVKGLKTIVPISAISSWYEYDRSQGLPFSYDYPSGLSRTVASGRTRQVDCSAINSSMDRQDGDETGAYTKFWSKRDYRSAPTPKAGKVKASMLISYGLQDTNVKTIHFGRWYELMQKHDVTTKVWLSRLGHVDPFDYRREEWVDTLHRWFDNQLMKIDNGILDEPRVDVETSPNHWVSSDTWPVSDRNQKLRFHKDGSLTPSGRSRGTAEFVNDPQQSESRAIAKGDNDNRLLFVSGSLEQDLRISGEPQVKLAITPDGPVGQVGVALVDYGTEVRVRDDGDGVRTLATESCWGRSTTYDDACYRDTERDTGSYPLAVIARGWARLEGGQTNKITVHLAYNDVVIKEGHQLGIAIFGASPSWLVTIDDDDTPYTVDLAKSSLKLPIVGDLEVGADAGDLSQVPSVVAPGVVADGAIADDAVTSDAMTSDGMASDAMTSDALVDGATGRELPR